MLGFSKKTIINTDSKQIELKIVCFLAEEKLKNLSDFVTIVSQYNQIQSKAFSVILLTYAKSSTPFTTRSN